jgi:arsenate reductase
MPRRRRLLILCTGNSCRSQMAEGWVNHLLGGRWEAHSAGTAPADAVNPLAVEVMGEVGVDLSDARPDHVDTYLPQAWDLVVTVCDAAKESCPVFPGTVPRLHVGFEDPADALGSTEHRLAVFRRVRDDIRQRLIPQIVDWQ